MPAHALWQEFLKKFLSNSHYATAISYYFKKEGNSYKLLPSTLEHNYIILRFDYSAFAAFNCSVNAGRILFKSPTIP